MLFFIHATEDMYCGLHGVEDMRVEDLKDVKEANDWGREMSEEVICSYGMESEYGYFDEDEDEEDSFEFDLREHLQWTVMKIKDEYVHLGAKELERIATRVTGADDFMKKYCEYIEY